MNVELLNELEKNFEFMEKEYQKQVVKTEKSLDVYKKSVVPNVDNDLLVFVRNRKELKQMRNYLKALKKVIKFHKKNLK